MGVTGGRKGESLVDAYELVEESFYELVEETSRLSALLYSHPDVEYEPEMATVDLLNTNKDQLEDRIQEQSEAARDSLTKMDAALLLYEDEVEEVEGIAKYELRAEKIWFRGKYIELEEEIRNTESTALLEKERRKGRYDRPDFDVEKELEVAETELEEPATDIKHLQS